MEVESVFVTGANRGIGLEFVKQLVNLPTPPRFVFATYRNRNTVKALKDIRESSEKCQVLLIKMDITKSEEIEAARKIVEDMVGEKGLNFLINNAGFLEMQAFPEVTDENLLLHFMTNAVGPIKVLKEMLPLLQKAAACQPTSGMSMSRAGVLNISSSAGSMALLGQEPPMFHDIFGYRMSKVAQNMAMRAISLQVKDQGILVVQICPGWVKTDMGTDQGLLEVSDSISTILSTLTRLDESHQGAYISLNGDPIPF